MTLLAWKNRLTSSFSSVSGDCAQRDAELLLTAVLHISHSFLFLHPEYELTETEEELLAQMEERRMLHEPIQYILGTVGFMGYEFRVSPAVLIPRSDTECLVEAAIPYCKNARVLDLCTGSGCIAISVALLAKGSQVTASDLSEEALAVAKENALRLGAEVTFCQGDYLSPFTGEALFDVIISNPPYITKDEMRALSQEVCNEPFMALFGGTDGLDAYRRILKEIPRVLRLGGYLFFEIGYLQGPSVAALMEASGFEDIKIEKDYAGNDRIVFGRCIQKEC